MPLNFNPSGQSSDKSQNFAAIVMEGRRYLEQLEEYMEFVRPHLTSAALDLVEDRPLCPDENASDPESYRYSVAIDNFAEMEIQLSKEFPSMLYAGALIAVCSCVEQTLDKLSNGREENIDGPRFERLVRALLADSDVCSLTSLANMRSLFALRNLVIHGVEGKRAEKDLKKVSAPFDSAIVRRTAFRTVLSLRGELIDVATDTSRHFLDELLFSYGKSQ